MSAEQDIIVLCRRLIRSQQPYTVINLRLSREGGLLDTMQIKLMSGVIHDLAKPLAGQVFVMSGGDMFVILRDDKISDLGSTTQALVTALAASDEKDSLQVDTEIYRVPTDYAALRERTNAYLQRLEGAKDSEVKPMRGPLTISLLAQIERVLEDVDLGPYLRSQTVFDFAKNPAGEPLFTELFTSLPQLKRQLFPDVRIDPWYPLFQAFLYLLDVRILDHLIRRGPGGARAHSINVTMQTLEDPAFKVFINRVVQANPNTLLAELHVSEVFRDITESVKRIRKLQDSGLLVILDGLTLESAQYLNVGKLPSNWVKLAIPETQLPLLAQKPMVAALQGIGLERVIVNRFETAKTMQIGRALGLNRYQGWLADELHQGKKTLAELA